MQYLSWVLVGLGVVLLFGAAIFVHELGHFLVARRRGLKVEGFSIGFGPKIFGWKRNGIDYAWRWIPAGGYVKLPQMVTSEALEGGTEKAEPLPPAAPGDKILVALAGPVMNALFAVAIACLLFLVGLPVRVDPAIVGGVEPGSPEEKAGIRPGDRVVAVNGARVKSWEEAQMAAAMAPTKVVAVVINRDGVRTTYHLATKVNEELGLKLLDLEPLTHPVIKSVMRDSAGQAAGLKSGDEVLLFAGVPIVGQKQLVDLIQKRPGESTRMEVLRGAERLTVEVTPRLEPQKRVGRLGIEVGPSDRAVYVVQWPGPAPWTLVGNVCQQTFDTIGALVHSGQTGIGVKDLSGPPGIVAVLAAELKVDYRLGLKFMVLLNISLAILNLLPLPVLDGGHIVMALLEELRGRPLSPQLVEYLNSAFAVLLISLMLYVSYNDVVRRLPLFQSLFDQKVQIENGSKPDGR